jgi:hypothetical protein
MLLLPPVQRIGPPERPERRSKAEAPAESAAKVEPPQPARRADDRDEERRSFCDDPREAPVNEPEAAPRRFRQHAPLVAQVIATALGFPQTRARRRASPADAIAAYRRPRMKPKTSRGLA